MTGTKKPHPSYQRILDLMTGTFTLSDQTRVRGVSLHQARKRFHKKDIPPEMLALFHIEPGYSNLNNKWQDIITVKRGGTVSSRMPTNSGHIQEMK